VRLHRLLLKVAALLKLAATNVLCPMSGLVTVRDRSSRPFVRKNDGAFLGNVLSKGGNGTRNRIVNLIA